MTDKKDPPVQELDFLGGVKVVDIGDIRVARGMSRRHYNSCQHKQMVYDSTERRIWCKDCENNIDSFDAFSLLVDQVYYAYRDVEKRMGEAVDAQNHNLHLIACKNLEKVWRGGRTAPCCPHCTAALLPIDFHTIGRRVSAELEKQRRENKQ